MEWMSWLTPEVTMAANQEKACYVGNQRTRGLVQGRKRNLSSIQILQLNKFVLKIKITVRSFMQYWDLLITEEEFKTNNLKEF